MFAKRTVLALALVLMVCLTFPGSLSADEPEFTDTFRMDNCKLKPTGENDFFILKPGCTLLLMGEDDGESVTVLIEVLKKTIKIDGVKCRIVRETEWADGELTEISWNYFAICKTHKGVFYFGEDVDIYEDGEVVAHDGAWRAGVDGAKPGLIMPGYPLVGSRYYQEVAPGVAEDRAEHKSVTEEITTEVGTFKNCLHVEETTPLEPGDTSIKVYAPGVGLVRDDALYLVDYGKKVDYEPEDGGGDDDDDDDD